MKKALIHDYFIFYGGSEKVTREILNTFPNLDLYTLFNNLNKQFLKERSVNTSFLQSIPLKEKFYRYLFPLMPLAVERFDLSDYDLVISSSHAVAKNFKTNTKQLHVCYCHSPLRYIWNLHEYFKDSFGNIKRIFGEPFLEWVREWDYKKSQNVDYFIANSHHIRNVIDSIYNRKSKVIYPPVDVESFEVCEDKSDFYLTVSRLVPYKNIELIVDAFSKMPSKKLIVIGAGPEESKIKKKANRHKNIKFLGYQNSHDLKKYMGRAKAVVFAAKEDFGMVPVEAQACGTPVIAYEGGGNLETVEKDLTGIFFKNQTTESLIKAVREFESKEDRFSTNLIRENAENFGKERFRNELNNFINKVSEQEQF